MSAVPRTAWTSAGLFAWLLSAVPAFAATPQEEESGAEEQAEGEETAEEEEEAEKEEEERWFAIVGGDVYTGTGGVLRGTTLLGRNGQIREIGRDLVLPEGTETLEATGMRVYPGLVAIDATSRISGGLFGALEDESEQEEGVDVALAYALRALVGAPDGQEQTEGKSEIEDSFDPFSQYLVLALATGITTAEQQNAAIKLKRGEIDGVLLRDRFLTTIVWSISNPSSVQSAREKFAKAAEYLRKFREWDKLSEKRKKEEKEPSKRGVDPGVLSVLKGETLARFNANSREDLLGIARLAQEYGFRPVIVGCQEGWTVAEELGRAGSYAVITPRDRSPKDERFLRPGGTSIENAAILWRSGVQVAIRPMTTAFDLGGITGRDLMHLPVEAGFGVRGGLPEAAALQAITVVPARILGCDHRVGTLEIGKDLDAIVTDGDLLHYETFVQYAVVDGKLVYDKEKEIFFAHIRPRPKRPDEKLEAPDEEAPEEPGDEAGDSEGDEIEKEDEDGNQEDGKR